jgi:hypothetical protein
MRPTPKGSGTGRAPALVLFAVVVIPVGAPGFEPGTSCPPDKRANQAAPRPVGDKSNGRPSRPRDLSAGIASDASGPPDKRANQAAPRPATSCCLAPFAEALVQAVDQRRHLLEALRNHAQAVLAEVLGLDVEG